MDLLIVKGNIVYMTDIDHIKIEPDSYLICQDGLCKGIFKSLPEEYADKKVKDYGEQLIIPGMVDLHLHAPQYAFRGLGMDMELLDWLNAHAFPEESKYQDVKYAQKAYEMFVNDLRHSMTTRACIFATLHREATWQLANMLESSGLITMVGKVNMDRNSNDYLIDQSVEKSIEDTEWLINHMQEQLNRTLPILTPRFVPSCTDEMMTELGKLQKKYKIPVQSHLSENPSEVDWVKELNPKAEFYGDAYDMFGLFGKDAPAVMAHCVYSPEEEVALMKEQGVYVAHCPCSNTSIASGIAPIRKYIEQELHVGLGTDIAGGFSISMFRTIVETIGMSKMYWRYIDQTKKPITLKEAFYLATMGGGELFGKVGSFMEGYEADILVIDDSGLPHPQELTLEERLERVIYLERDNMLTAKYVKGMQVL